MQSLTPNKSQPLIQLQTRRITDLGLKHDFIRIPRRHGVDGHAHEIRRYALASVGFLRCEHGDVAPVRAAAVWLEFADYDCY
jgi:hypothetical protein